MTIQVDYVGRLRQLPRQMLEIAQGAKAKDERRRALLYARRPKPTEVSDLWRMAKQESHSTGVRAQIILMSANNRPVPEIAEVLGITSETARRWIHRFNIEGTDGLFDRRALFARKATLEEQHELRRMRIGECPLGRQRAQIILQSQRHLTVNEIAEANGVANSTVRRWINRFNRGDPSHLLDRKGGYQLARSSLPSYLHSGVVAATVSWLKRLDSGRKDQSVSDDLARAPDHQYDRNPRGATHAIPYLPTSVDESIRRTLGSMVRTSWLAEDTITHNIILATIMGLAIGTRVFQLNGVGFNSDEAVYAGQGAAIAHAPVLSDIFPVFRAHPLLFQFTLALFFSLFGTIDWLGRVVSVGVGIITVYLVYRLGRRLYGPEAGLIAALIMALMPYHVVVTRQVLLDGPMALFATITLWLMVRFAESKRSIWLYSAGAGMGLTFLAKETGILMIGAIYAFLALSPQIRVRIRDIGISLIVMVLVMLPFPLSLGLAGGGSERSGGNYLVWQLFRRANHSFDFYLTEVPPAIGILVIVAAAAGLLLLWRRNGWKERLLVLWIVVPTAFFQLWPTKGFQYLLPVVPAVALLAARTLAHWPTKDLQFGRSAIPKYLPRLIFTLIIALTLFRISWSSIAPAQSDTFLAGSGGIPGGRETGQWIQNEVPEGSIFMTIGPSMANIIKWYGHQDAYGLSISPNPLHRNPSYEPIYNPDYDIRTGELQYLVWDSYSAGRTSFFSEKLLWYVQKYNGRAVHTETVMVSTPQGATVEKPVIIVYKVHP